MDSDSYMDKEYENLNDAILKSIVSSKEIQEILIKLKKEEQIDNMAVLNLFLSLDELYEMISEKDNASHVYKLEPVDSSLPKDKTKTGSKINSSDQNQENLIDGNSLTQNEILFEKFYQNKFNEKTWAKKARIQL